MRYEFTIDADPRGKGRPRATKAGGFIRMHTDNKTIKYEKLVAAAYRSKYTSQLTANLSVSIDAVFGMPSSWSEKKRLAMEGTWCSKNIDADNIAKIVCDGLNGVAYEDDRFVVLLSVSKRWGRQGFVKVVIEEME